MNIVISLGGSLIVPDRPDYFFLREFKNIIVRHVPHSRFIIVCGGGNTSAEYNGAAQRVTELDHDSLDWLGIMATRLNAELVRVVFGQLAAEKVIIDPTKKIRSRKQVIVGAGWKPGRSTDYVSVHLAKELNAREIINLTNISHVYNKDPKKHPDAYKLYEVSWKDYKKIVGRKWEPRMNSPFDPVATREAHSLGMKVIIMKGLDNLEKHLSGKPFDGSIIQ